MKHPGGLHILVANEPRTYREVLAGALRVLRPECDVRVIEPERASGLLSRRWPDLVFCSHASVTAGCGCTCVQLYPDGERRVTIRDDGCELTLPDLNLAELLALVDRVEARLGRSR